jgi:predicted Zn finger-like uncharacterized protein
MLIVCPNCGTSYQLEPPSLGQDGRSVRCARCRNIWFATPTVVSSLPGAEDWDVIDSAPPTLTVRSGTEPSAVAEDARANFAAPKDIDVAGLRADIDSGHAALEAEPNAVLLGAAGLESPSLIPADLAASPKAQPVATGEDIETVAARRARRDAFLSGRWLRPGLPAAILILLAVNAGLIAFRMDMVRLLPQTAPIYAAIGLPVNLRGLAFENIRMSWVEQEGVSVLVVEGSIVNVTGHPAEVPRLRLALRNDAQHEIYAWSTLPSRSILAPGDALPFRSRLASPPVDAREVKIRFLSGRDAVAGLN